MDLVKKQSGLGIVSFSVLVAGGLIATAMIAPGWIQFSGTRMGGSGENLILGGAALGFVFALVALGLGIAGLCQNGRKKGVAILGTVLSSLILLAALPLVLAVLAWVL
jgi:hypothetical protein